MGEGWNALADRAGHALLRHEWFVSAAEAFHGDRLAIVAITDGGRLVAVAPLAHVSVSGIDRLEFIGASSLHEPGGFLYEDAAAHQRLVNALLDLRHPLVLQRLPAASLRLLSGGRVRRRGFMVTRPTPPCLGVPLAGSDNGRSWPLPGKLRYDLKRARTRAAEYGGLAFTVVSPAPDDVDAHLDRLVAVEGSGWKGRRHSALACRPARAAFFRTYARLTAASGTLRLFTLQIGGAAAAVQMAVEVYGRLWVLKVGYDETFARCSPGLLLTHQALQYAVEARLESYEFLGSAERWEARWRPEPREHGLVLFYPSTLTGCLGASLDFAGLAWRRLKPAELHAN